VFCGGHFQKFFLFTFRDYLSEDWQEVTNWVPLAAIFLQYTGFGFGYAAIIYMLQSRVANSN
jgi:hypothetical protein